MQRAVCGCQRLPDLECDVMFSEQRGARIAVSAGGYRRDFLRTGGDGGCITTGCSVSLRRQPLALQMLHFLTQREAQRGRSAQLESSAEHKYLITRGGERQPGACGQ